MCEELRKTAKGRMIRMKIKLQYGHGVLSLPEAVLDSMSRADAVTLRVLLALSAARDGEVESAALAEFCDCSETDVDAAIAFWRGAGLVELDGKKTSGRAARKKSEPVKKAPGEAAQEKAEGAPQPEVRPSVTALPAYSTEELASVLERRAELRALIDECSHVFGKIFNTHEVSQLIGLADYLRLEDEYLLLLLAHCAKLGKKSLRYAVNLAIALFDDGVTDTAALQECLKARERREEAEGKLRAMFGLGSRALTSKEKKMFDAWTGVHGFSLDAVRIAYEKTVAATGKASVPYANSILERWAAAGLKTVEAINEAEAAYEKQSVATPKAGNSFDTDDFFEAALQRSFGDAHAPDDKK
jgi:DnaD/phage-associated family protein